MNPHTSLNAVPTSPETADPSEGGAKPPSSRSRSNGEREALLRFATAAAGASDLTELLELAGGEALAALDATALSISKFEGESRRLRTLINLGTLSPIEEPRPDDEVYEVARFPRLAEMARTGKPYFNSLDDPDCDPASAGLLRQLEKTSDLSVAIHGEEGIWGTLWAATDTATSTFRGEDVSFLEAMAGQLGAAISRAELFSRVSRLAYEDPLTGLANRRAFDERLERAVRRYGDEGKSLTLLLCDVDRLKMINDVHGHVAGDRALIGAGEALLAAAADHPGAFVARLAGDEFCVLVEGRVVADAGGETSTIEDIGATAQRLLADGELAVTLSCGAVAAARRTVTPAQLLRSADDALYVVKRRGGGRICTAGQEASGAVRRLVPSVAGSPADRIRVATEEIVERFDGELAEAPVLDRIEAVAKSYAEAADFASWAISFAVHGTTYLRDLSVGENRRRQASGVRVASGPPQYELYELDEFPATAEIIAAGTGSIVARVGDPGADPAECELLEGGGLAGVVGATAGDEDGAYLLELFADRADAPLSEVEAALRMAMRAAIPPRRHRRDVELPSTAHSRALELSLALADRLAEANAEREVCEAAVEEIQAAFGCPVVHLVAVEADRFKIRAERGPVGARGGWSQRTDAGLLGRCLSDCAPVLTGDVAREPQYRSTEATRGMRSELAVPILVDGSGWGAINLEHTACAAFTEDDARLLESVASQVGGALQAIRLYESLDRAYVGTAEALSAALEEKDSYTAEHSRSIAKNTEAVGRIMGMADDELRMLRYAAAFHDIGKLAISREILNKPGPLTDAERIEIEQHTVIGERILAPIEFLAPIRPLVRSAHERWDGGGYPDGLEGREIPLGARILFACDAYDAMTTDRPYRSAMPLAEAREELRAGRGSQFDPTVIDALITILVAEAAKVA